MKFASLLAVGCLGIAGNAASTPKTPLTIQVYRHANSCQNIATNCLKSDATADICKDYDYNINDSTISDYGVQQSKELANGLDKTDAVMTSTLLRAIETALYMFPKLEVYPVPYIKEVDYKPPNVPLSVDDQLAMIEALDGASNAARVNYTYEEDPDHICVEGDKTPRCQANWDEFLSWLGRTLATDPPVGTEKKLSEGKHTTLSLVTHSIMITSQILQENIYISNNYGTQANFTFNPKTEEIVQVSDWEEMLAGAKSPCNNRAVSEKDTQRCAKQTDSYSEFQQECVI